MKKLLKSQLSTEKLIAISISDYESEELSWKEDHEFYYKNNLYDVVRSVRSGKQTIYYCINDEQEKNLFSEIDELIAQQHGDKTKCKEQKSDKEFLQLITCLPDCLHSYNIELQPFISGNLVSQELNPESPPPRFFHSI